MCTPGEHGRQQPAGHEETDERFPSGPWKGFWLQRGLAGRQWMAGLHLRFAEGRVEGEGTDCVGDFVFSGSYDLRTGRVTMLKQYVGAHAVEYDGRNDNDGLWLWGLWRIRGFDSGGFHMWPAGVEDPTQRRLEAEEELPAAEPALV